LFETKEHPMKTLATVLFAVLCFTGCATDTDYADGGRGLRPGYKPSLDSSLPEEVGGSELRTGTNNRPDINESFEIGTPAERDPRLLDDGRVVWAEVLQGEGAELVELHHFDAQTGIDSIEVLDDNGLVLRIIETRVHPTEIPVDTTAL
jgi:hypothetical protein